MGSIDPIKKRDAIELHELYRILDNWLKTTNERTIGDVENHQGRTAWLWVRVGEYRLRLHADATRDGISALLHLTRSWEHLEIHAIANSRGNVNKIAFGPTKQTIPGVFFYLSKPLTSPRRLI